MADIQLLQVQRLAGIEAMMRTVQVLAEQIAKYVLELEQTGLELPNMKQTAATLAQVALGWEAGEASEPPA